MRTTMHIVYVNRHFIPQLGSVSSERFVLWSGTPDSTIVAAP